jgi:hypothetical protein
VSVFNIDVIGDVGPTAALFVDLNAAGVQVEFCQGQASPVTGYGREWASADWHSRERIFRVYLPAVSHAHQLFHEILHCHFGCVKGMQIVAAAPGSDQRAQSHVGLFNNDFDHIFVIQREIETYPEAAVYWDAEFRRVYEDLDLRNAEVLTQYQNKITLLKVWAVLSMAMPKSDVWAVFETALKTHGYLDVACAMTKAMAAAGHDKRAIVEIFSGALGFDYKILKHVSYSPW